MKRLLYTLLIALSTVPALRAQNEMDDLLNGGTDEPDYAFATFKSFRIVNQHSIEHLKKKHLLFIISHRFDRIDKGFYDMFGLDQAQIRLGLDYGVTDWLQIGVGRSTFEKTYDGYAKVRLLRQSKGAKKMPVSLSLFGGTYINSLKDQLIPGVPEGKSIGFENRVSYATQIIIARKFNSWLSLQLTPAMVHRNYVQSAQDQNSVFALNAAARVKVSNRVAITGEYSYLPTGQIKTTHYNAAALGVDIETGGHVFQLHLTNARPMIEKGFIAGTNDDIGEGGIYFGFNIVRTFSFDKR